MHLVFRSYLTLHSPSHLIISRTELSLTQKSPGTQTPSPSKHDAGRALAIPRHTRCRRLHPRRSSQARSAEVGGSGSAHRRSRLYPWSLSLSARRSPAIHDSGLPYRCMIYAIPSVKRLVEQLSNRVYSYNNNTTFRRGSLRGLQAKLYRQTEGTRALFLGMRCAAVRWRARPRPLELSLLVELSAMEISWLREARSSIYLCTVFQRPRHQFDCTHMRQRTSFTPNHALTTRPVGTVSRGATPSCSSSSVISTACKNTFSAKGMSGTRTAVSAKCTTWNGFCGANRSA